MLEILALHGVNSDELEMKTRIAKLSVYFNRWIGEVIVKSLM